LFSGGRVPKDHVRIEAYGCLDELNAVLGLLQTEPLPDGVAERLAVIQDTLFEIGSVLADPKSKLATAPDAVDVDGLEAWIDDMELELKPLRAFIRPGGSRGAAVAHLARTVCRRAERRIHTVMATGETLPPAILPYVNRLSDAMFVLGRFLNARAGLQDPEWRSRMTSPSE
jgi:cob(I)alamin adenosyltransferase